MYCNPVFAVSRRTVCKMHVDMAQFEMRLFTLVGTQVKTKELVYRDSTRMGAPWCS
jgi:hypothetical protein